MTKPRILVVDDDPAILKAVKRSLEGSGFDVSGLALAGEVVPEVRRWRPDVVVLDLVLPDGDGVQVCRAVREFAQTPIVVLSAINADDRKVLALDAGADDYVVKPFSMPELQARIRAAIRRSAGQGSSRLVVGPLELDVLTRRVTAGGQPVHLTPKEYELFRLLITSPGRVFTQRHLLGEVWGREYLDDTHILRTFIHQLRSKLSSAMPGAGSMLVNDPGVGYRIELNGPLPG